MSPTLKALLDIARQDEKPTVPVPAHAAGESRAWEGAGNVD